MGKKRVGLFTNTSKPDAVQWAEKAAKLLVSEGAECCVQPDVARLFDAKTAAVVEALSPREFENFADVVVSFGGDGTMLSAARTFLRSETPIMGINFGKLGFLTEYSVDELHTALFAALAGDFLVEERAVLEARVQRVKLPDTDHNDESEAETRSKVYYAWNDFVMHKRDNVRMITVSAEVDGHHIADYRADGLIVATPTGSTAYSLSSGGPIIMPTSNVLVITPICPHTLNLRPLVVPNISEIVLDARATHGPVSLIADGDADTIIHEGERVIVKLSDLVVKLVKRHDRTYYDLLKKKLLWSAQAMQG